MTSPRTFVGFGFGPIQSALFLFEAFRTGQFRRFVVAEIDGALVQAVRELGGSYRINIAHPDRIEQVTVTGVQLLNPAVEADRQQLIEAIGQADEICTALPSVKFYDAGGSTSVARLLAQGFQRRGNKPGIIYTAENHNLAAQILTEHLTRFNVGSILRQVQPLNTVIGKMSGVITDAPTIARMKLATLTPSGPGAQRAVLVEAFNRILISRITTPGCSCGIPVFVQKDDLLPFEEAKLYGHNAIHALIGYLANERGLATMDQAGLPEHRDLLAIARKAFLEESGAALCRKYAHLGDALFTPDGYREYAEDLLVRMVNPNLNDLVTRVIRDPRRKIGLDDRLFGTMRLALEQGVEPRQMARGTAAAVRYLCQSENRPIPADRSQLATLLGSVWTGGDEGDLFAGQLIDLTWQAMN